MDWLRALISRCRALFGRRRKDAELDEELRAHIELAAEENRKRGLSANDARTAALREFGGVTQIRERYRTQRGLPWLEVLAQDVRFAVRMLWTSPGFSAVAVLTLAIGIGGNTAIFSIVNGVLLNPLPFPHPEQLVGLDESKPNFPQGSISYPNFLDWRKDNRTFSSMALARRYSFSLTGKGDAEQVQASFLSSGFFAVLGVRPLMGREFTPEEDKQGAAPVAMISEGLWRRKFNAAPDILGQSITLDGKNFSIVGVMPAKLHFPRIMDDDVFAPIPQWTNSILMMRGAGLGFHGIGRLKPGVTAAKARADMERVTRNLAAAYPNEDRGIGASVIPLKEQIVGDTSTFLELLLAAVGFVLLLACVNVASLLLARSAGRSREFAVRAALGATRARVIGQLLTESLLLGIAAAAIALLPAIWGTHAALKVLPAALPRADEVGLDLRVLAFTLVVSLLTGVLFGLAPALKTSRANPQDALKSGGRGAVGSNHRVLGTFVVVELAIALVLLSGAGLLVRSLVRLWNVDPGFNPRNVVNIGISLPPSMANASMDETRAKLRELNERFAAAPGITAVSQSWGAIPMNGEDDQWFWMDGQPKPKNQNEMNWVIDYIVDPDYLRVMQIPLKRGRFLARGDDEHSPLVVVVDDVFAQKFFPGQDAIGRRIRLVSSGDKVAQIVGIVGHVKQWGLDSDDTQSLRAEYYLSCMQMPDDFVASSRSGTGMMVRYKGSLGAALDSIRQVSKQMSDEQVIFGEQTMESILSDSLAQRRFAMILLGAFAALAVLLACIGIYGVMAYLVSQRTQEVGIRMALGAKRSDVLAMVLRNGARLAIAGAAAGMVGAIALTRLMRDLLFEVSPTDPLVLGCVCVLLILVALAACIVPARRAASIEPMQALRTE
ncbi:MAG TPA: ABC transporter permease [Terracidiphilus sp.]|nr:ABC transporter permease [Terracidiphilus sp.]